MRTRVERLVDLLGLLTKGGPCSAPAPPGWDLLAPAPPGWDLLEYLYRSSLRRITRIRRGEKESLHLECRLGVRQEIIEGRRLAQHTNSVSPVLRKADDMYQNAS